jgi:DNA-binding PadR family transcriptional regulator
MLAILTLGPAYGSQLHSELTGRTPHRSPVNVGQIYTTIERLGKQGLLVAAGTTDDGLPLHELTAAGRARAQEWMTRPHDAMTLDWTEMMDQVLITASIDQSAVQVLVGRYRRLWAERRDEHPESSSSARLLTDSATRTQAAAAVEWLEEVERRLRDAPLAHPYAEDRPRRGRPSTKRDPDPG